MTSREQHLQEWSEALQDWLDGELSLAARAKFDTHLAGCGICREQVARFKDLDAALAAAAPPLVLDQSFDRRLFAQIDASDERSRAAKRRVLERQLETERLALARGWRRGLAIVIPSVIAGIALALTLSAYIGSSEIVRSLIADGAAVLGGNASSTLRLAVTCVTGAGIGLTIARWLSPST